MITLTSPSRALVLMVAATILAVGTPAAAQMKNAPASPKASSAQSACAYSPSDAWVVRQATFFDDSKHDWSNDTLRTALLNAAGIKALLKAPVMNGVQIDGTNAPLGATAPAMIDHLKKLGADRAAVWPTRSVVGAAGVHAVYLLAQQDSALGRSALHHMMEAGPLESPAIDVAVFEDNLRLQWGRKQLYGTQFVKGPDGKVVLKAMEDSAHADMRREGAGLPPFKLGLCFAQKM